MSSHRLAALSVLWILQVRQAHAVKVLPLAL
jgi:hypothetical protein